MLIRTLLLAIFLISSALSVCAAEPATMPTTSSDTVESTILPATSSDGMESITMSASSSALAEPATSSDAVESITMPASPSKIASAQAMTMDEALKHVTVSAEDWLDGNTYYIRYTFTNPTAVAIDKKVDLTVVNYRRHAYNDMSESSTRGSTAITALVIPPHNTYTTTLEFPIFVPIAQYYHIFSTTLYFTDGSTLYHGYRSNTTTLFHSESDPPLYLLSAFISDKNDLCLAIRNRSRLTPITSISGLTVQLNTSNGLIDLIYPDFLPINIPPRQTQIFKLMPLSPEKLLRKDDFAQDDDLSIFDHTLTIKLNLNDTLYSYLASLLPKPPFTTRSEYIDSFSHITLYRPPLSPINFEGNAYRIDGSDLSVYFQLTNPTDQTICAPSANYILSMDYFTTGTYYQAEHIKIVLPADFTLAPQETKFFSCQVPLVTDFYMLDPKSPLKLHSFNEALPFDLHTITLVPLGNTELPHPSADYQPLKAKITFRSRR